MGSCGAVVVGDCAALQKKARCLGGGFCAVGFAVGVADFGPVVADGFHRAFAENAPGSAGDPRSVASANQLDEFGADRRKS